MTLPPMHPDNGITNNARDNDLHPLEISKPDGGQLATVRMMLFNKRGGATPFYVLSGTSTKSPPLITPRYSQPPPPPIQMPATVRLVNSLIATLKTISPLSSSANNDLSDRHHTLAPLPPQRAPPHHRRISPPKLTLLTHPHLPPPRNSAPAAPQHPRLLRRLLYHSPLLGCRVREQAAGGTDPLKNNNNFPGVPARHSYSQPWTAATTTIPEYHTSQTRRLSG